MRFTLDGQTHDLPTIDSLTIDETILLERYAGVGVETFVDGRTPMGAVKALMVIGLMRDSAMSEQDAAQVTGQAKLAELDTILSRDEDEPDAGPLAQTNGNEPNESDATSGSDGAKQLVPIPADDATLAATGFRPLPTGATFDQPTLED